MGVHEEIIEATRADVLDDWIAAQSISRMAQRFGLPTKDVGTIVTTPRA
jgi:hypothetical protein